MAKYLQKSKCLTEKKHGMEIPVSLAHARIGPRAAMSPHRDCGGHQWCFEQLWSHAWGSFLMRWLHVFCGVVWVGLLWYLNFVQTPSMAKIPDAEKPAITRIIAPAALFWFRHAAL